MFVRLVVLSYSTTLTIHKYYIKESAAINLSFSVRATIVFTHCAIWAPQLLTPDAVLYFWCCVMCTRY